MDVVGGVDCGTLCLPFNRNTRHHGTSGTDETRTREETTIPPSREADLQRAGEAIRIAGEHLGIFPRRSASIDALAFVIGLVVGVASGAIAALLTAPADGTTVRARVRASILAIRERAELGSRPEAMPATITLTTIRPTTS